MKLTGRMKLELMSLGLSDRAVLVIDSANRILAHYVTGELVKTYHVSLGEAGIGNLINSQKTPHGIHTVCEKVGEDEPAGAIFESRKATGEIWQPGDDRENLILSRILRLKGEVSGINEGPRVDSYERFIYIHGTNREDALGCKDVSHGCILMSNEDVINLYNKVQEGCVVIIS